ncbi:hypothetical protein CP911_28655 [Klebsiella quasipneumoniae]|uniref:Uncharacterized protein n=1 Tax=Klebsiella quasipneumoniae TaxID=1463165 RepID=A0A2A5MBE3_9ENTR|nr:hypothetical protein CP911_28655 [Klebsiella quasipneumoniae]
MHLAAWSCSRVKFICHERGGVSGGLLSVLPDCRPVCGEPVRSGAGKRCYGKSYVLISLYLQYQNQVHRLARSPEGIQGVYSRSPHNH